MTVDFLQGAQRLAPQLIDWRRELHRHPELAFMETRTASMVANQLHQLGLEVQTGVGKTGVVALLDGASDGPTVLLRFDMDALPIREENQVPYASVNPGVMHACGHDGHTAIGLAVAHLLSDQRNRIHGRVKFVFQPAEEIAEGAQAMIQDGVLQNPEPEIALGLHLWNTLPVGQVGIMPGPVMAGADIFDLIIRGAGGHGASPHETRDPLLAGAHIVTALQSVISRNVNPLDSAVLSVTSFTAGTASNIIPSEVSLKGTIRTYTDAVHDLTIRRLKQVTEGIAQAMGCVAEVTVTSLTPPLVNHLEVTQVVQQAIAPYTDPENLLPDIRTMGAEDMAIFLNRIPGCFFFVGSANSQHNLAYPHHHPRFDFDEAALPLAAAMLASAAAAYVLPG
ncbi:MAG: amidohydrolase [Anaerolineae bacterium]|nr:amidohydrolase [Anaerolineae bacterium]